MRDPTNAISTIDVIEAIGAFEVKTIQRDFAIHSERRQNVNGASIVKQCARRPFALASAMVKVDRLSDRNIIQL